MNEESITQLADAEVKEIERQVIQRSNEVAISDEGELVAQTDVELIKAVGRYRKMGLVPKQFDTDAKAAGAILFAKQIGFNPLSVWGQIACIHGKYCAFGSLFTSMAKRDPEFGEDQVFFLDEKQEKICMDNKNLDAIPFACVIKTRKKGSEVWNEFFFTVLDAEKAGIYKNVWKTYPRDLLFWKAISRSYRAIYPLALQGVMMAEDLKDDWSEKDVTPKVDLNTL
jgi:hypothetical protein